MSGRDQITVIFEVLPEERPGERSATEVYNELDRQLRDPRSVLRTGEFGDMLTHGGSLSAPGSGVYPSEEPREFPSSPPLPPPVDSFGSHGRHAGGHTDRHHPEIPVGNMSNGEILDQIGGLERQLALTAGGRVEPSRQHHGSVETEALADKCSRLEKRLYDVERQLEDAQKDRNLHLSRAMRLEQNLKDREQLLVHAKEMWMKESGRASKLADALTSAEDRLADQERRLQEVSDRYNETQSEVRQLRHLLDGPDGGGFGGGFSAYSSTDGYPKVPMTSGPISGPISGQISPPNSSNVVFQPSSAFDRKYDEQTRAQPMGSQNLGTMSTMGTSSMMGTMQQGEIPMGTGNLSAVQPLPPLEAETNSDRFRHLCLCNDAVLYEDDMLQVGLKTEYRGLEGQLAVFYGNKSSASLQAFQVNFQIPEEGCRLTWTTVGQQLDAHDQVQQRVSVNCIQPFVQPPMMRIQYLMTDACPRRVEIKVPVIITKFMQGLDLRQDEFFHLWRSQRFVLNEVTSVVNLATRLRAALVHIQRSIAFGGALRLHFGFDPNPDNFVLVGQMADESSSDREKGVALVRTEVGSGRFQGKARVVVRAGEHAVARGVCEAIVLQLTQASSSGFEVAR